MVNDVVIICDASPIGSNSALESIRMGAGISAVGDLNSVKIIFTGDSIQLLNKRYNPEILGMDTDSNVLRMIDLADIEIYVLDIAMKDLGVVKEDLVDYDNVSIISIRDMSKIICKSDVIYNY